MAEYGCSCSTVYMLDLEKCPARTGLHLCDHVRAQRVQHLDEVGLHHEQQQREHAAGQRDRQQRPEEGLSGSMKIAQSNNTCTAGM